MRATIITKPNAAPRVLLTDEPIDDTLCARLERAGYSVRSCTPTRLNSADAVHNAIEPMLTLDLFGSVSP